MQNLTLFHSQELSTNLGLYYHRSVDFFFLVVKLYHIYPEQPMQTALPCTTFWYMTWYLEPLIQHFAQNFQSSACAVNFVASFNFLHNYLMTTLITYDYDFLLRNRPVFYPSTPLVTHHWLQNIVKSVNQLHTWLVFSSVRRNDIALWSPYPLRTQHILGCHSLHLTFTTEI